MSKNVIDHRVKWDKIKKSILNLDNEFVTVGVQSGENTDKGASIAEYAFYNEYGTESQDGKTIIPARSFIRSTMDESRQAISKFIDAKFLEVVDNPDLATARKALGNIGQLVQGLIQKKITILKDPPNRPRTIVKKGSSNPLIDTGQLRSAIRYKVSS